MYSSLRGLLEACKDADGNIVEAIILQEIKRFDTNRESIIAEMVRRRNIMEASTREAIYNLDNMKSTFISGMAKNHDRYWRENKTLCGSFLNNVMAKAMSCSETNAAMGKICAMPTAGSCGIVPAVIEGLGEELKLDESKIIDAYIVAAGTGAIAVENATVSGAEGGCQAECGVAAAMAASAATYLKGGSPEECIESFAISLINIMGLVCDPVAGYVQIPCIQRNASQAVNALLSSDLALGGMKCGIEPDEVIEAMYKVGKLMPIQHKETSMGGIAATESAKKYEI